MAAQPDSRRKEKHKSPRWVLEEVGATSARQTRHARQDSCVVPSPSMPRTDRKEYWCDPPMRSQLYAQNCLSNSWPDKDGDVWLVELTMRCEVMQNGVLKIMSKWRGWRWMGHSEKWSAVTTKTINPNPQDHVHGHKYCWSEKKLPFRPHHCRPRTLDKKLHRKVNMPRTCQRHGMMRSQDAM